VEICQLAAATLLRLLSNQNANPADLPAASASEFGYWNYALSQPDIAELVGLEEPTNTVAPTFNATTGDWTVGTWDSYSNGSLTYTVLLKDNADDSTVATLQTDSATTSGNCLADLVTAGAGTYYIRVAASNTGGNDPAEDTDSATGVYTHTTALRRKAHHHAAARVNA
jgi:hypothetical protein